MTSGPHSWTLSQSPNLSGAQTLRNTILLFILHAIGSLEHNHGHTKERSGQEASLGTLAATPVRLSATVISMNNLSLSCDPVSLSTDSKC